MPFLTIQSPDEIKTFTHDEGDTFTVRDAVDKKTFNKLLAAIPDSLIVENPYKDNQAGFAIKQAPELAGNTFPILAVSWSLSVPCTQANYHLLTPEAAAWIDVCLLEQIQKLVFEEKRADELGKPTTSPKGLRKGTPESVS